MEMCGRWFGGVGEGRLAGIGGPPAVHYADMSLPGLEKLQKE